jgi:hypothetical protein
MPSKITTYDADSNLSYSDVDSSKLQYLTTLSSQAAGKSQDNIWYGQQTYEQTPILNNLPTNHLPEYSLGLDADNNVVLFSVPSNTEAIKLADLTTQDNTWSKNNNFMVLPTTTLQPTIGAHFVNKTYADSIAANTLLPSTNLWSGSNMFVNPPLVNAAPTSDNQLVNKAYADSIAAETFCSQTY